MRGAAKLFLVCKYVLCTHQNVFLLSLIFDPPVLDAGSGRGLKVALRREEKGRNVPCVGGRYLCNCSASKPPRRISRSVGQAFPYHAAGRRAMHGEAAASWQHCPPCCILTRGAAVLPPLEELLHKQSVNMEKWIHFLMVGDVKNERLRWITLKNRWRLNERVGNSQTNAWIGWL